MDSEPTYTLYIRLPFPRADFVDPPPVNWDSAKDEALWDILSGVSKREIDWDAIANDFDVTVDFLLQQVTYLTERHTAQVRAQMRKLTAAKGSAAPSPVPQSDSAAAMAAELRRTGSAGGTSLVQGRAPSSLSIRRDGQPSRTESTSTNGPTTTTRKQPFARPQATRTLSGGTDGAGSSSAAAQQKTGPPTPRYPVDVPRKRLSSLGMPTTPTMANMRTARHREDNEDVESPGPADSSSESSSSSSSPEQSRIIRRPPRFSAPSGGGGAGDGQTMLDDDDEDAEPAFLPPDARSEQFSDPAATLRGEPHSSRRPLRGKTAKDRVGSISQSNTSDSSTGSAALVNRSPVNEDRFYNTQVSPRRTAELSGRTGSGKGKVYSRDGSDGGTPSMGSSFSDLDDASVTQSALEEALASNMQDATIGSRMSTIGQAFRSRYLPTQNRPGQRR